MKVIPITQRYNSNLPSIGSVEPTDIGLRVRLNKGTSLSRDEIFQIFGCPSVEANSAIEVDGDMRYSDFTIKEFTRPACYEPVNSLDESVQKAKILGRAGAFDDLANCPFRLSLSKRHFQALRDRELAKIDGDEKSQIKSYGLRESIEPSMAQNVIKVFLSATIALLIAWAIVFFGGK